MLELMRILLKVRCRYVTMAASRRHRTAESTHCRGREFCRLSCLRRVQRTRNRSITTRLMARFSRMTAPREYSRGPSAYRRGENSCVSWNRCGPRTYSQARTASWHARMPSSQGMVGCALRRRIRPARKRPTATHRRAECVPEGSARVSSASMKRGFPWMQTGAPVPVERGLTLYLSLTRKWRFTPPCAPALSSFTISRPATTLQSVPSTAFTRNHLGPKLAKPGWEEASLRGEASEVRASPSRCTSVRMWMSSFLKGNWLAQLWRESST